MSPEPPGPPGLTSMTPWYADAGEVCLTRESASLIVPLLRPAVVQRHGQETALGVGLLQAHVRARTPGDRGERTRRRRCRGRDRAPRCTARALTDAAECAGTGRRPRAVVPAAETPPSARHPAVARVTIRLMAGPLGAPCPMVRADTFLLPAGPVKARSADVSGVQIEVTGGRRRRDTCGAHALQRLQGAEQPVVVEALVVPAGADVGAGDDGDDPVALAAVVLVPREHQQAVVAGGPRDVAAEVVAQPTVRRPDRAVVHVVVEVRHHERQVRQRGGVARERR